VDGSVSELTASAAVPVVLCGLSVWLAGKCRVSPIAIVIGAGVIGAEVCG
jgi:hypothetical protein